VPVVEVIRPNRQAPRRRGKSDTADAVAAALAALNGEASGAPKSHDGAVESIRALRVARRGAVKAATQAANQLRDLIVTAPEPLRAKLGPLSTSARVALAARFRPGELTDPIGATKQAMASLARRYQRLHAEITDLDAALEALVARVAPPSFAAGQGVGLHVAAARSPRSETTPTDCALRMDGPDMTSTSARLTAPGEEPTRATPRRIPTARSSSGARVPTPSTGTELARVQGWRAAAATTTFCRSEFRKRLSLIFNLPAL